MPQYRFGGAHEFPLHPGSRPKISEQTFENASTKAAAAVRPISDIRGGEDYRREMVKILTKRVLEQAFKQAKEG